jgi:hypothetical protein
MKRMCVGLSLAALPISLSGGCGLDDEEFRSAPPAGAEVTIGVPGRSGSSSASGAPLEEALLGATSEYYQLTYAISTDVNLHALALLGVLHLVTSLPATTRTADSRTWGPYTPGGLDPLTYEISVTRTAAHHYSYGVLARPRASTSDSDFVPLLDGTIVRDDALRGTGNMTLQFDNRRRLVPDACESGTIGFVFDDTGADATLDVTFTKFGTQNPANVTCKNDPPRDAVYHYKRAPDGSGDFVFAVETDIEKVPDGNLEDVSIRSRWQADGAGRSDVRISGGDVTPALAKAGFSQTAVTASQCWGIGFATVFESSDPAQLQLTPNDGDASRCVFTSAMLP